MLAIALAVALPCSSGALAASYPTRAVTIVVPFAAGGPTATLAHLLSEQLRTRLGQPVIVENVPGASGSLGVGRVANAAPDGYTLIFGQWDTHVLNGAIYPLSYDVVKDFAPVARLPGNPQLIVSKNAVPAKNLSELIAWLKANPDKAAQGTAGAGSAAHISGASFQLRTGTRFQFVPYRGAGPAMQDLVAGHIDLMFDQASNALPQVREGKIRAYAVTASARLTAAPEIPTVDEAGLVGFHVSVWRGLWAPKGTPKEIVARLNAAVTDTFADLAVRQRIAALGQEIPPREQQTPEALAALQKAEIEKWWPIIKTAGIKAP
jgi:tripartite-type tricarboxylate transporter receptor subunit TctC